MPMCIAVNPSSYETGQLAPSDDRLFRPGGMELTAHAVALAQLAHGSTVLDLGCGSGESVRYLCSLGLDAIGVDPRSDSHTRDRRDSPSFTRILASADDLPFPDSSIDAILLECSLSVMQHQDSTLAECARVLTDGGRLIITDLYARQPDAISCVRSLKTSCISRMFVISELESALTDRGFKCDCWEDHSQALRECAARFIFERGSLDGLFGCVGDDSAETLQAAMRAVRAGYFLLLATRTPRRIPESRLKHER